MPFTFSHPVIVFPLLRKKDLFSATGLIIGSIAPDFESFIKITGPKIYSHTWPGIFWFDLPLTVALCYIFHNLMRKPIIDNLPRPLLERAAPYRDVDWNGYMKEHTIRAFVSMIIGITSHLLFDAFTHLNMQEPGDQTSKIIIAGQTRLYILLQYSSSFLCMGILGWCIDALPRVKPTFQSHVKFQFWLYVVFIAGFFSAMLYSHVFEDRHFNSIILINIVIASVLSALLVTCIGYTVYARRNV